MDDKSSRNSFLELLSSPGSCHGFTGRGDAAADVGTGLARDISRKIHQALFAPTTPEHGPAGLSTLAATTVDAGVDWADPDAFTEVVYTAENAGATVTGWYAHTDDALALSTLKENANSARNLLTPDATACV